MHSWWVAAALWLFLLNLRGSASLLILFNLPATLAHELAHWGAALLTGARPSFPSLWPSRVEGGWKLGSVSFEVRSLSAGLVALAPLLLAPWAVWGLWQREVGSLEGELMSGIAFGYLAWASLPSSTDWVIALRYPVGSVLAIGSLMMTAELMFGL